MILIAPLQFSTARLAWYDTGAINDVRFFTKDFNGQLQEIPSNYFASASLGWINFLSDFQENGFLPVSVWGGTLSTDVFQRYGKECPDYVELKPNVPEIKLSQIDNFLQEANKVALTQVRENGHFRFNQYPHHVWSAPPEFDGFEGVNLTSIKNIIMKIESRCVEIGDDGKLHYRIYGQREYDFEVSDLRPAGHLYNISE